MHTTVNLGQKIVCQLIVTDVLPTVDQHSAVLRCVIEGNTERAITKFDDFRGSEAGDANGKTWSNSCVALGELGGRGAGWLPTACEHGLVEKNLRIEEVQ